jgi:hypothetical protein
LPRKPLDSYLSFSRKLRSGLVFRIRDGLRSRMTVAACTGELWGYLLGAGPVDSFCMDYTTLDSINRLRHRSNLIFGFVFLAIGVVALGLAVLQLASTAMLFSRTKGATGRYVESVDRRAVYNGGTFQHARFQFRSADGKIWYATASDGSTQQGYAIGDTASIRYEPTAPDHAIVCSFWTLWLGPLFCGAFAFGFGLPGLMVLMRERRAR